MDKSLHLFDTEAEFQTKYWSAEYEEPWVSLTEENGNVKFNKSEYERMLETPLTFEITGAGDICWLFINNSGNGEAKTLEYKKNDGNWTEITSTTGGSRISVSAGDEVQFRGDNVGMSYSSTTLHYRNEFSGTTAEFKVKGNIMSLLDKDDYLNKKSFDQGAEFAFFLLFNACSGLTDASNMVLPATALTAYCYRSMFQLCANLVHSPEELPATVLAEGCYRTMFLNCPRLETAPKSIGNADTVMAPNACHNMFQNAVSLTKTPELPATTMAAYCYYNMFYGCTSLSNVPEVLPATTLAERCYEFMFYGTNITKAPDICATTVALCCCEGMFRDCTNLRSAPSELPATTMAEGCYRQMFHDCPNLTDAPELPATALANSCYYSMFGGCVKLKNAPELPASELAESCYAFMFNGCTSLGSSPKLSATTLAVSCYESMFRSCTNLTVGPPILPAATMYTNSCKDMFYGCTKLRNAPRLPATTLAVSCYEQMFYNCSSLLYAQTELPASTLAESCYKSMFAGCSSIKVSPALSASVVPTGAYMAMFSGCSQMNFINCMAVDISATHSTTNWTSGVAATGRFKKNRAMGNWTTDVNGIPVNWTVEEGSPKTDYTLHDSTYMVRSQMQRIPDPLAIKNFNDGTATGNWTYQDGIMLKAIIDVYNEYNAQDYNLSGLLNYVNAYYNTLVQSNGTINTSKYTANELDDKEPAVALMSLYDLTNTAKYKSCLDMIYNDFTGVTKNADGVYWHKSTYPRQGWLDGLYMAQPFRAEYASKYLTGSAQSAVFDDVCLQITKMAERTYDSTTGLYRHAYDASSLESQAATGWTDPNSLGGMQSYYAWGRGLGWMMSAIVDVLDYLPSNHTGRTGLINILTGACASIKTYADPTSGVWRNVPTEGALTSGNTNALESTSSSMFAYAFLKGVRKGYLPSSERTYALTLFTNLKNAFVSESGGRVTLANTCTGGNPGASATTSVGVLANYCSKNYMSDNTHGEAPYIWAALEYERLTNV